MWSVCVCACAPAFSLWSVNKPYLHVLNSWWCVGLRQCVWWRGCLCAKLKWSGGRAWALTPLKNPTEKKQNKTKCSFTAADWQQCVASFHSLRRTSDILPQKEPDFWGAACQRVICTSSVVLEIIANPKEEGLVCLIHTSSAAALLILLIPYMLHILCAELFKVERFSFDTVDVINSDNCRCTLNSLLPWMMCTTAYLSPD